MRRIKLELAPGKEALIDDFHIYKPLKHRGYGGRALTLLDEEMRSMVIRIGLCIFGDIRRDLSRM